MSDRPSSNQPRLTWGEPEHSNEPDPELETLAELDRINDRFAIALPGDARD